MSENFITIKQASELTNKSEITIRRLIKGLLKEDKPETKQMIKQKRAKGGFIFLIKEDLLRQKYNLPSQKETDDKAKEKPEPKTGNKGAVSNVLENEVVKAKTEIISLLKGELYKKDKQLKTKDWQIGSLGKKIDNLIERDKETNFILKSLQDRVFMLEAPKEAREEAKNKPIEAEITEEPQKAEKEPIKADTKKKQAKKTKPKKKLKKKGAFRRLLNKRII